MPPRESGYLLDRSEDQTAVLCSQSVHHSDTSRMRIEFHNTRSKGPKHDHGVRCTVSFAKGGSQWRTTPRNRPRYRLFRKDNPPPHFAMHIFLLMPINQFPSQTHMVLIGVNVPENLRSAFETNWSVCMSSSLQPEVICHSNRCLFAVPGVVRGPFRPSIAGTGSVIALISQPGRMLTPD
jgi:hypothetical protein